MLKITASTSSGKKYSEKKCYSVSLFRPKTYGRVLFYVWNGKLTIKLIILKLMGLGEMLRYITKIWVNMISKGN